MRVSTLALFVAFVLAVPAVARADDAGSRPAGVKRVALIVGNSAYQTIPQLPNPARDAAAMAQLFRDAGFDTVQVVLDAGSLDFRRAIREFEMVADQADIAVVYYAGHGLEIGGISYLFPVDARLATDHDVESGAIPLERLASSAGGARRLRLIIIDACRQNSFFPKKHPGDATRVLAGLGNIEPDENTLVAYAARAHTIAEDGSGPHSPYTTSLLKNLTVPGLDVRLVFGRVKDEVNKATGGRQEPWVYGSLGGGNVSLVPGPEVPGPDGPKEQAASEAKADYELVAKLGTARAWQIFLGAHPTGHYADLARAQLARLQDQPRKTP
jgi:uncharacterized caspase-like protein